MTQHNVESVLGRLLTDERLRRRFTEDREALLSEILEGGCDLNPREVRALRTLDGERLRAFAEALDPCIQKVELRARVSDGPAPGREAPERGMSIEAPPTRLPGNRGPRRGPGTIPGDTTKDTSS